MTCRRMMNIMYIESEEPDVQAAVVRHFLL